MGIALLKSLTVIVIYLYVGISALLVAIVDLRRKTIEASPWARRAVPFIFLLASAGVLLCGRRFVLRYDRIINPDEALMAANAMQTHHGWLNWNIVDPLTSGPLNSMVLAWPYLFGGDITLYSTRLTGIACVYGMAASLFLALRRMSDDRVAIITVAPVVIYFAGLSFGEFVHYSSEQFPILLLAIAIYLFARSFGVNHLGYLIGAAFVVGMAPFAKLQAAPMSAVIGGFVVARAAVTGLQGGGLKSVGRNVAAVVCAGALPAIIFLVPLYVLGGFDDFVKSYFIQQRLRVTVWNNPLPALIHGVPVFSSVPESYILWFVIAVIVIGFAAAGVGIYLIVAPTIVWSLALGATLVPVAFVSIAVPGRTFFHYLLLAIPALIICGGAVFAAAVLLVGADSRRGALLRWLMLGLGLAMVNFALHLEEGRSFARVEEAFLQGQPFTAAHTLAWLRPTKTDHLVCWGWQAECYVNAAIAPGTREATNENQLYKTALNPYFRTRFLSDFLRSNPDFVVDVVAPGSFAFTTPASQGIESFPEFSKIIARDFVLMSHVDPPGRCPRIYVRRTRLAELDKSLVTFTKITATGSIVGHPVESLDDRSIFETCDDNWLLPPGKLGTVTIEFRQAGPLASVAILNTRNLSKGDYASDRVRFSARFVGKTIVVKELTLEPFPRWTYIRFDKPVEADSLTIDILSYRGLGAGLNEVKAYRD